MAKWEEWEQIKRWFKKFFGRRIEPKPPPEPVPPAPMEPEAPPQEPGPKTDKGLNSRPMNESL